VINDILDLSKVKPGRWRFSASVFALRTGGRGRLADARAAENKRLRLEPSSSPSAETVLTDPLRLRQVLVNLVGNAIKFTDHGEIRIATDSRMKWSPTPPLQRDRHGIA